MLFTERYTGYILGHGCEGAIGGELRAVHEDSGTFLREYLGYVYARGDRRRHVFRGLVLLRGLLDLFLVLSDALHGALVLGVLVGLLLLLPVEGPLEAALDKHGLRLLPLLLGPMGIVELQGLPGLAQLGVV